MFKKSWRAPRVSIVALNLTCLSTFAAGAVNSSVDADQLDTVIVTATRTQQPLTHVGQSVSVIDSAAIVRLQSDTVLDLLRTLPGLSIVRNGGIGGTASVFIRGAESDQTVALIDGVKLNDPASPGGGFNFGNLLSGNIARIEVLRGSQTVLWGSQAIGGVVNLITTQPNEVLKGDMRAEFGWRNTRQIIGNVSQKFGRLAVSLGAGDFRTDGISAFSEQRGGRERDGYRNSGAHAAVAVTLSDAASLDLRGWYSDSKADIDGFAPPTFAFGDTREYSRTRELVGYSALNVTLLDGRLRNRLAAAYTRIQRANFDPDGFLFNTFDGSGRNTRFEYQGTLDISKLLYSTFGAEIERSRYTTVSFGGAPRRGEARIDSVYAEIVAQPLTGLTTIAGLRHDRHDEFGGKSSASASLAWTPNEGATLLRASYSEGFKAPTLYQLQSEYGNGLLRPETARGGDVGITERWLAGKLEAGITGFRRDSRELVSFISCFAPLTGICAGRPFGTYDNVARAQATGVEATLIWRPLAALTLQTHYSQIRTENRSPGSSSFGKQLVRRPQETASALLDYHWSLGLETGLTLTHVGASFDNATNTRRIDAYNLVDLRLAWPLTPRFTLQARVENLLDKQYETSYSYGAPGRALYAGLRFAY